MADRVYLDWNATAPLRPEARDAMMAAMDLVGNPSSVHAEGRAAKGVIETGRAQVAELVGCEPSEIVFTSGATEAAALVLADEEVVCSELEHESVAAHCRTALACPDGVPADSRDGSVAQQGANSETGILQNVVAGRYLTDQVQVAGKLEMNFATLDCRFGMVSAHKFRGPKGVGGLLIDRGVDVAAKLKGGGQEMGRRSGTENVIGIAGFGAAATAAQRDLDNGEWDRVAEMRDEMEAMVLDAAPDAIVFGKDVPRLPNTSNFAVPGWRGETQVMQMDLAGFAVSAGSACSSGKVQSSRVLKAMGFDDVVASSAIRVSMGPTTKQDDVTRFADVWIDHYRRFKARAA